MYLMYTSAFLPENLIGLFNQLQKMLKRFSSQSRLQQLHGFAIFLMRHRDNLAALISQKKITAAFIVLAWLAKDISIILKSFQHHSRTRSGDSHEITDGHGGNILFCTIKEQQNAQLAVTYGDFYFLFEIQAAKQGNFRSCPIQGRIHMVSNTSIFYKWPPL